ncbi:MAG: CBS domain-containing protein [Myxococcales bacterium]|nr:CBS domain-containing protein [Myxococcales bacterium]
MMKVCDLMTSEPMTATESTSLLAVWERMNLARIRHMPVVRGARLVGLVSSRDVLAAAPSRLVDDDEQLAREMLSRVPVAEVMKRELITVLPDTELETVCDELLERKIDCLPVVDADGNLLGIVTASDFLKLARTLLQMTRRFETSDSDLNAS